MLGDVSEEASQEYEYRRGYRDGWISAANLIIDIWFMRSKQRIYDVCFDHYEGALWDWLQSDCGSGAIYPPEAGGAKCVYCGAPAQHMDHVIPKSRGGGDDQENLVPACARCNLSKRDRLLGEWRQK